MYSACPQKIHLPQTEMWQTDSATNKPAHHLISSPIIQKMIWKQWILNTAEILFMFINRMHVLLNLQKVLLWRMETIDRFGGWLCFEHARLLGEGSKVTIHHHLSGPNKCAHTQTLV